MITHISNDGSLLQKKRYRGFELTRSILICFPKEGKGVCGRTYKHALPAPQARLTGRKKNPLKITTNNKISKI